MLTQRAVWVQTAPKIFIKSIESTVTPNYDYNELVVHSVITFTNCGKTEAKNLTWSYIIEKGGKELLKKDKCQVPYLYPEQNGAFAITDFRIRITPEQMKVVKQAQELKKGVNISSSLLEPIFLNIKFEYESPDGEKIPSHTEQYKFLLAKNQWVIPVQKN